MHRSLKIQTFQLTSNEPTLIIENTISLELGLYYSNRYRNNVDVLWLLQLCYIYV
jgi:hypothetical protein